MLCQSVYMFRRTSGVYHFPKSRKDLDDRVFEAQISLLGGHQLMVDASQCSSVSSIKLSLVKQCASLLYLDLSYTQLASMREIADQCTMLRSLVLAGLAMQAGEFHQLSKVTTLEVLSLRNSKNAGDKAAAAIKHLIKLRSLDLGFTQVADLSSMAGLTRLEELVMDSNTQLYSKSKTPMVAAQEALQVLTKLQSLKILNLTESPAIDSLEAIALLQDSFQRHGMSVYIEPRTRRIQFCDAIMNNDTITMRRLAHDGIDVNMELGPWFAPTMLYVWKTRCRAEINGRIVSTPCFMCKHEIPKHRPNPLALAVMFNAQGCLMDLLFMGAHPFMQVWFGEVSEANNEMVINAEADAEKKQRHDLTFYFLQQLPQAMFDRNVHRLTDGHVQAKTSGWKDICKDVMSDLDMIIKGNFDTCRQIQRTRAEVAEEKRVLAEKAAAKKAETVRIAREEREKEEKQEKAAELAAKRAAANPAADAGAILRRRKKEEAEKAEQERINREAEIKRKANIVEGDADFLNMLAEQEAEDQRKQMEEEQAIEQEQANVAAAEERSILKTHEIFLEEVLKEEAEDVVEDAIFEETPIPYKKPGRQPLKMLPEKPTPFTWRDHGMVLKLNAAAPVVVTVSAAAPTTVTRGGGGPASPTPSVSSPTGANREEGKRVEGKEEKEVDEYGLEVRPVRVKQMQVGDQVYMLGKRSFWNESRAFTLSSTIKREQEARALHEQRRKEDRIYNMTATRLARQHGHKLFEELKHLDPLEVRKKKFHALVKYDFERKFLVRGEIEVEQPPEEEQVSDEEEDPNNFVFDDNTDGSLPSSPSASSPSQTPVEARSLIGTPAPGSPSPGSRSPSRPESPRSALNSVQMVPTLSRIDSVPVPIDAAAATSESKEAWSSNNSLAPGADASINAAEEAKEAAQKADAEFEHTHTAEEIGMANYLDHAGCGIVSAMDELLHKAEADTVTPVNGSTDPSPRDETPTTKSPQTDVASVISPAPHSEPAE